MKSNNPVITKWLIIEAVRNMVYVSSIRGEFLIPRPERRGRQYLESKKLSYILKTITEDAMEYRKKTEVVSL